MALGLDYYFLESAIKENDTDIIKEMIKNKSSYADMVIMKPNNNSSLIQLMAKKGSLLLFETFLPYTDLSVRTLDGKSLLMSTCENWNWGIQSLFWDYVEEKKLPYNVWGGQLKSIVKNNNRLVGTYDDLLIFLIGEIEKNSRVGSAVCISLLDRVENSNPSIQEYMGYFSFCRSLIISSGFSSPLKNTFKYNELNYDSLKHPFLKMLMLIESPLKKDEISGNFDTVSPLLIERLLSKIEGLEISKIIPFSSLKISKGLHL